MVIKIKPKNYVKIDMDRNCKPQTFISKRNELLQKVADKEIEDYLSEENK